jgi:pimeloyl-ACP methyl ester carboxylesterase
MGQGRLLLFAAGAMLAAAGCAMRLAPPTAAGLQSSSISGPRVGSVLTHHCFGGDYYCGTVPVDFDPAGRVPGKIDIAFAWLPHSGRTNAPAETIVAVEGGPGYPSIESRDSYRQLYAPLLATRDLLLVDNRGTGRSSAVVCRPLQRVHLMKLRDVTRCGDQLGRTSDLYGTALAADDMAQVLKALHVGKVDLYGDSYGSFFVQAFAGRYSERVRSIVLDGAYQVTGGSPWYPSTAPELRDAFNSACARSPVCARIHGSSVDRISRLLVQLRSDRGRITPANVAFVMDSAGLDPLAYRDLDAAARAYLDKRDSLPLQRLVTEAYSEEEGVDGRARGYSQGLFAAASCADNPQAYDMRLQPPERVAAWKSALERERAGDPNLYAPFSIDEYLGIPLDYAYLQLCTTWPVASKQHPAGEPVPPHTRFPNVPVLVLNGDLDTITTPEEGRHAAALFSRATHVIVANTGHVTALDDFYGCAASIVRRFGQTGKVVAQCAAHVPAVHLVPAFSRTLDEVHAVTPVTGNQAPQLERRAAAAALLAAADVLSRSYEFFLSSGPGLRGGSYAAIPKNASDRATLSGVRWTNDLAVSGTADFNARNGSARAHLTVSGAVTGSIDASWPAAGSNATAQIHGTLDGYNLEATMPAP